MKRDRDLQEDSDLDDDFMEGGEDEEEGFINEEEKRRNLIISQATEEQRKRYYIMQEVTFYRASPSNDERLAGIIKNIVNLKPPLTNSLLQAISAASKIYIGELVEEALQIVKKQGDTGAISTIHLHQARLRLRKTSKRIL